MAGEIAAKADLFTWERFVREIEEIAVIRGSS